MTTNTANTAVSTSFASFQLNDDIATLVAIREAEASNVEAVHYLDIALDLICSGIDSLEEADQAVNALYQVITVTSVRPIGRIYGADDLECPWATDLFAIADSLKVPWRVFGPGALHQPGAFGDDFVTDEEIPF